MDILEYAGHGPPLPNFEFDQVCGSGEPGTMSRTSLLREKCPGREQEWPDVGSDAYRISHAGNTGAAKLLQWKGGRGGHRM